MAEKKQPTQKLATHTLTDLYYRDQNLVTEMMGKMTFTEAMIRHILNREPCIFGAKTTCPRERPQLLVITGNCAVGSAMAYQCFSQRWTASPKHRHTTSSNSFCRPEWLGVL